MQPKYIILNFQLDKPKILCIVQLPPPIHGVTVINSSIINSPKLNDKYLIDVVNLQFVKSYRGLSKFSPKKLVKSFDFGFKILKKVLKNKPDLVYFTLVPTGFAFYRDAFYVMLLKLFNLKILIHLHGKGIKSNTDKNILKKKIYAFILKNTNVICLSEILADDIRPIYKNQPYIIPNGIELHQCNGRVINDYKKSGKGILQILYLSNFVKTKGLLVLIEALGLLKKQDYDFEARFVGEPYDLTYSIIDKHLKKYNLTSVVKIMGPAFGDKKIEEFKNADIFVFPSYFEAFGLVNLEAMQFSLPVISTIEGSIPDIVINNETGFLVEKQNALMLAEKIAILLENKELRIKMGKKRISKIFRKLYY